MKLLYRGVLVVILLSALAYGGAMLIASSRSTNQSPEINLQDQALIERGAYIAHTADCAACHTVPGGKAFAGGLAMQTPIGAIFSTNITPDKTTGIGEYSFAEFDSAVRHGVRKDGAFLYPAMPYPSYAIMPEDEIVALYAYFMSAVEPVAQANAASTIPPIANWRWPLAYWQLVFAPARNFVPDPHLDAIANRGAYLVEGPGHCGACHTPRGIAYQEKSMGMQDGEQFLTGALIDGWRAKSLRSEARGLKNWSEDDLVQFFQTGRNSHTAAFGAMAEVVEHSTRHMTPEDNLAMARYLKGLSPAPGKALELPKVADNATEGLLSGELHSRGAVLYSEYCSVCHRPAGEGVPRIFPALAGNSIVLANYPQSLIQVTLEGSKMPHSAADVMAFTMPEFKQMSDADIAEVVNFIRNSWGNQAPEVSEQDVAKVRQFVDNKTPNILTAAQGAHHE